MRTRGYRDDFFLKVVAAAQAGDPATLAAVLRRQRVHLLTELRSLTEAKAAAAGSPVVALLVKAAELHVRADLGVVDAAEHDLTSDALAALRLPHPPWPPVLKPARHEDRRGGVRHSARRAEAAGIRLTSTPTKRRVRTPLHFQSIAHRGACGKTRVVPQNGWPRPEPTETESRDARARHRTARSS